MSFFSKKFNDNDDDDDDDNDAIRLDVIICLCTFNIYRADSEQ